MEYCPVLERESVIPAGSNPRGPASQVSTGMVHYAVCQFGIGPVNAVLSSAPLVLAVQLPAQVNTVRAMEAGRTIQFQLVAINGYGWQLRDVRIRLTLSSANTADFQLSIAGLILQNNSVDTPVNTLEGLTVSCPHVVFSFTQLRCEHGTVNLAMSALGSQPAPFSFTYQHDPRVLHFSLPTLHLGNGTVEVIGKLKPEHWQLSLAASQLQIDQISRQFARALLPWLADFDISGSLNLDLDMSGANGRLSDAKLSGNVVDLTFSDPRGSYVGEQVHTHFRVTAIQETEEPARFRLRSHLAFQQGQVYLEPVFLEIARLPVTLSADINWQPSMGSWQVSEFVYTHPDVIEIQGGIHPDLKRLSIWQPPSHFMSLLENPDQLPLQTLRLSMKQSALSGVYATYLQPFLIGTKLDAVTPGGQFSLELEHTRTGTGASISTAQLALEQVDLIDQQGRYALEGLSGSFAWVGPHQPQRTSQLMWSGGQVYRIPFGQSTLTLSAHGRSLDLLTPTDVPVLEGAVHIEHFHLEPPGTPAMEWQFEGRLEHLSLRAFSQAVGWPALSGTLSGAIPRITYRKGIVQVDGHISIQAFAGSIEINHLKLEDPFSLIPRLFADIEMRNLDLEKITETFTFGRIQGRLSGAVHQLVLHDWQPVAFDARFATPTTDDAPHRISQKAVDNLASLGGVSGVLSRSVLRFFDDFSYTRLGLSCRLEGDVCEMDGVASTDDGYYIVKGGGLPPRINVIGKVRRVAWLELVDRLQQALVSGTPEIR